MRTYNIKITDAQRKALLVAIDEARHCGFHDAGGNVVGLVICYAEATQRAILKEIS